MRHIQPRAIFLTIIALGLSTSLFADLTLRIVDCPRSVWIFSPLIITAELQNNGNSPLLVPVTEFDGPGWTFEIKSNEQWKWYNTGFTACGIGSRLVWLQPGDRYLFQYDLNLLTVKQDTVEVRASLNSSGECQQLSNVQPPPKYPTKKIRDIPEGVVSLIECWKGELKSEPHKIDIELPDSESEQEILKEALAGKYSLLPQERGDYTTLANSFRQLYQAHPKSFYTYAAAFYAPPSAYPAPYIYSMPLLFEAQPNNPLTPYARLLWVLDVVEKSNDPYFKDRLPHYDIPALNLPDALNKYLEQEISEMKKARIAE
jgi:hypothetical protein